MINSDYRCTQAELYLCCRLGFTSCSENLAAFTAFKSKYTSTYITTNLAAIDAAENLPGNQARSAQSETYRLELVELGNTCRSNFQSLKRYIDEAFAPEMQKPQYEAAGQQYYEKASQNNWAALSSLNTYADNYITAHTAILSSAGYMPSTFATQYSTDRDAFTAKHLQFMNQEEQDEEGTQAKIIANNDIYTSLINMCLDGQEIFKNDTAKYKQFVFADILIKASSAGTAGIRGKVTSSVDSSPIANAAIQILDTSYTTATDADGNYLIKPLAVGRYDVRFSAPPLYRDKVINNFQISTGTTSTLDAELDPV
jgi:hypothetical protein